MKGNRLSRKIKLIPVWMMLIFGLSAAHVSALTINLMVSDSFITPGERFNIEVWANGVFDTPPLDEVLAFGFDVTNPAPSIVRFDSATVGALFNDDSALFPDTDVAGSAFPGITDYDIHLATLNFTALRLGRSELCIASDLQDLNEGLIYFLAGSEDITSCRNVNVIPEPSTYLLLGFGLAGFAFMFRRKMRPER